MDIKTRIGNRLRAIRKAHGLSQEQLASLTNRSVDTISNVERGETLATYETLEELAKGLKVPLADFFLGGDADDDASSEAMARLTDAARQLDPRTLNTAAALIEVLVEHAKH